MSAILTEKILPN